MTPVEASIEQFVPTASRLDYLLDELEAKLKVILRPIGPPTNVGADAKPSFDTDLLRALGEAHNRIADKAHRLESLLSRIVL
jgi:hypothetical protein